MSTFNKIIGFKQFIQLSKSIINSILKVVTFRIAYPTNTTRRKCKFGMTIYSWQQINCVWMCACVHEDEKTESSQSSMETPYISKFDNGPLGAGVTVWGSDIYPALKTLVITVTCCYRQEIFYRIKVQV